MSDTGRYNLDSYRSILALALERGWQFRGYQEGLPRSGRSILLRHDVDFSVEMAAEMAAVNVEFGIRGTFFLLLRSNIYNLLAVENLAAARRIAGSGQAIGLHFAAQPECQETSPAEVSASVLREYRLLSEELPTEPIFAWHNPNPTWMGRFGTLEVHGLVNAYATRFIEAIRYRSDSNLRNRPEDFLAFIRSEDTTPLHLLFHPLNWVVGGSDMIEILAGTWGRIVRERENDFRTNGVYRQRLPHGMPALVIEQFERGWEAVARAG